MKREQNKNLKEMVFEGLSNLPIVFVQTNTFPENTKYSPKLRKYLCDDQILTSC